MPEYSAITCELTGSVATITLNRPEAANTLNETLSSEMLDAIIRSEENTAVRALVISGGTGRFFCAGADLKSFYTAPDALKSKVSLFHVAISRIVRAPFPVIAAVNGTAAGGGMGLACSCDMILAGESTKFIMAYTRRGLTPDGTTTYFLPRKIGVGRALDLAYTSRSKRRSKTKSAVSTKWLRPTTPAKRSRPSTKSARRFSRDARRRGDPDGETTGIPLRLREPLQLSGEYPDAGLRQTQFRGRRLSSDSAGRGAQGDRQFLADGGAGQGAVLR